MTDIDKSTVAGLIRGDDDAYVAVLEVLKRPVYRFALRLCRDPATAEDITQQTFLAVWQSIGSFRRRSKFSTWVFGIAYRQHLLLRRQDEHAVETVTLEEWHGLWDSSETSDRYRALRRLPAAYHPCSPGLRRRPPASASAAPPSRRSEHRGR